MSHPIEVSPAQEATTASTEVVVSPKRKRYTPAFKRRILQEADRCTAPGELAALLRREGLYFSTLADFRKQKARGDLDVTPSHKADAPPKDVAAPHVVLELAASEREVRRLRRELACATALLELQKKVSDLLGLTLALPE